MPRPLNSPKKLNIEAEVTWPEKYRASSSSYSYHKRSRFIVFVVICYNQFCEITRKTCDSIVIHESLNTKAVLYWQKIMFLLRRLYLILKILWEYGVYLLKKSNKICSDVSSPYIVKSSLKINCSNISIWKWSK